MSNLMIKGVGMYDANMVQPMRDELTRAGYKELKTAAEVDGALSQKGTAFLVINSVCGCAAGGARPAAASALRNEKRPDNCYTVFAGQDKEATERARSHFAHIPPSSPAMFLLKDGEVVFAVERHSIEGRTPEQIAQGVREAFNDFC